MYTNYESLSGKTFVFVGQNATTGTPNSKTGRMSHFGHYHSFKSKAEAVAFAEQQSEPSNGRLINPILQGVAHGTFRL